MRINKRKLTIMYLGALGLWWDTGVALAAPTEPPSAAEEQSDGQSGQVEPHMAPEEGGKSWNEKESADIPETCTADALHLLGPGEGPALQPLSPPANAAVCAAAVTVAVSLGCAAIVASCAGGTVLTVGSVAIPCVLLTALACGAGSGAATIVAAYCPHLVRR